MVFSPQSLLSQTSKERCIFNINQFPSIKNIFSRNKNPPEKTAAVLVPLCVVDDRVSLLYTVRSTQLKSHSGQISFPGGKTDGNETPIQTALRETEEELGIPKSQIDVWGIGNPVAGRNNELLISPVIGVIKNFDFKALKPNADEVAEVFTVPVEDLCSEKCQGHNEFKNGFKLPVFLYGKHMIWGMTAVITHVFLQCLLPNSYKFDFIISKNKIEIPVIGASKL